MAVGRLDEIDAPVLTEAAVLGDDHCAREVGRDALDRHPLLAEWACRSCNCSAISIENGGLMKR